MTLKKFYVLALLVCLTAAFYSCDKGGKRVLLKFRYAAGDQLNYEQTTKGTMRLMIDDSLAKDVSEEIVWRILYDVLPETVDSVMVVRQSSSVELSTFNRIDSTSSDTVTSSDPFIFSFKPNGRVVGLTMEGDADSAVINFMRSFIEQSIPVFPAQEVTQGFTWAQDTRVDVSGEAYLASTNYEIVSFVRELGYDCAVIEYVGELRLPVDPAPTDSIKYRGMGFVSTKGVIYFAYRDGLVVLQKERWLKDGRYEYLDSEIGDSMFVAIEWDVVVKLVNRKPDQP